MKNYHIEKLCRFCVNCKFIKVYNTISIIIMAIFANSISQVNIDFQQNIDIEFIINNILLLISAILFQRFSLNLDSSYNVAVRQFYAQSKREQEQQSLEAKYKDRIDSPSKECKYLGLSLLFFLLYLFAIPIYHLICN